MAPRSAVRAIKPIDPGPKTSKQERVYLSGYMGYYEYQGFADLNPVRLRMEFQWSIFSQIVISY